MTRTLKRLDFGITITRPRTIGRRKYEYPPFYVKLDSVSQQVIDVPVHVTVDRAGRDLPRSFRGQVRAPLQRGEADRAGRLRGELWVDQESRIGEPFVADHLSFTIEFPRTGVHQGCGPSSS